MGETWYVFVYVATNFTGKQHQGNKEGTLKWIDDDKFLDLSLQPADKSFYPWLSKDEIFSAKFEFGKENDGFQAYSY